MIRINIRCVGLFALGIGSSAELGPDIRFVLDSGFTECENTIVLGQPDPVARVDRSLFIDPVGYEAAANEINVQPTAHGDESDPAALARLALTALVDRLSEFEPAQPVRVVLGIDPDSEYPSATVRFHRIRPEVPEWIGRDLEAFPTEGVMTIDIGQQTKSSTSDVDRLDGVWFIAELVRVCQEVLPIVREHLVDMDGELLLHLLIADIGRFASAQHAKGDVALSDRILRVVAEAFVGDLDAHVQNAVAVSFVENFVPTDGDDDAWFNSWPTELHREAERQELWYRRRLQ